MGMDLIPRNENRGAQSLHYNWSGWRALGALVPVDLAGSNDGERLTAADCRAIADAIEANRDEYNAAFAGEAYGQDPATEHAKAFRESGGMRQW